MAIPIRKLQSQASRKLSMFIGRFTYGLYLIVCRHESMLFVLFCHLFLIWYTLIVLFYNYAVPTAYSAILIEVF